MEAKTRHQLLRYGIVGLGSNATLYMCYLLLTLGGVTHKLAMTAVYCLGVLGTFLLNRNWAFGHGGTVSIALMRYVATYAFGYLFNVAALVLLVDIASLPHEWVMLAAVFGSAVVIFLLQKRWVFPTACKL